MANDLQPGARLRSLIDATGMQYKDFAKKWRIGVTSLSRYMSGTRRPNLEHAHRLEEAFPGELPATSWIRPDRRRKRVAA
jgi:transcriptional regulator with XRE-family HTH domain